MVYVLEGKKNYKKKSKRDDSNSPVYSKSFSDILWNRLLQYKQEERADIYKESHNIILQYSKGKNSMAQIYKFSKALFDGMMHRAVVTNRGSDLKDVAGRIPYYCANSLMKWICTTPRKLWNIPMDLIKNMDTGMINSRIFLDAFLISVAETIRRPDEYTSSGLVLKELSLFMSQLCTDIPDLDIELIYNSMAGALGRPYMSMMIGDLILSNSGLNLMYSSDTHPFDEFNRLLLTDVKKGFEGVETEIKTEKNVITSPCFESFLINNPQFISDVHSVSSVDGNIQELSVIIEYIVHKMVQNAKSVSSHYPSIKVLYKFAQSVIQCYKLKKMGFVSYVGVLKLLAPIFSLVYETNKNSVNGDGNINNWDELRSDCELGKVTGMNIENIWLSFILFDHNKGFVGKDELLNEVIQVIKNKIIGNGNELSSFALHIASQLLIPLLYSGTYIDAYDFGQFLGVIYNCIIKEMNDRSIYLKLVKMVFLCCYYSFVGINCGKKISGMNYGIFITGLFNTIQDTEERKGFIISSILTKILILSIIGIYSKSQRVQTLYSLEPLKNYLQYAPFACNEIVKAANALSTGMDLPKGFKKLEQGEEGKLLIDRIVPDVKRMSSFGYKYEYTIGDDEFNFLKEYEIYRWFPSDSIALEVTTLLSKRSPKTEEEESIEEYQSESDIGEDESSVRSDSYQEGKNGDEVMNTIVIEPEKAHLPQIDNKNDKNVPDNETNKEQTFNTRISAQEMKPPKTMMMFMSLDNIDIQK